MCPWHKDNSIPSASPCLTFLSFLFALTKQTLNDLIPLVTTIAQADAHMLLYSSLHPLNNPQNQTLICSHYVLPAKRQPLLTRPQSLIQSSLSALSPFVRTLTSSPFQHLNNSSSNFTLSPQFSHPFTHWLKPIISNSILFAIFSVPPVHCFIALKAPFLALSSWLLSRD